MSVVCVGSLARGKKIIELSLISEKKSFSVCFPSTELIH